MSVLLKKVLAILVWAVSAVLTIIALMAFGTYLFVQAGDKTAIVGSFGLGLAALACSAMAVLCMAGVRPGRSRC